MKNKILYIMWAVLNVHISAEENWNGFEDYEAASSNGDFEQIESSEEVNLDNRFLLTGRSNELLFRGTFRRAASSNKVLIHRVTYYGRAITKISSFRFTQLTNLGTITRVTDTGLCRTANTVQISSALGRRGTSGYYARNRFRRYAVGSYGYDDEDENVEERTAIKGNRGDDDDSYIYQHYVYSKFIRNPDKSCGSDCRESSAGRNNGTSSRYDNREPDEDTKGADRNNDKNSGQNDRDDDKNTDTRNGGDNDDSTGSDKNNDQNRGQNCRDCDDNRTTATKDRDNDDNSSSATRYRGNDDDATGGDRNYFRNRGQSYRDRDNYRSTATRYREDDDDTTGDERNYFRNLGQNYRDRDDFRGTATRYREDDLTRGGSRYTDRDRDWERFRDGDDRRNIVRDRYYNRGYNRGNCRNTATIEIRSARSRGFHILVDIVGRY